GFPGDRPPLLLLDSLVAYPALERLTWDVTRELHGEAAPKKGVSSPPPEPPPVTRGGLIGKTGCAGKSPRANRGESDGFLGPPGARKPKGAGGARSKQRQAEPPALALPRLRAEGPQHHPVARRDLAAARQELPEPLLPLRVHR